MKTKYCAKCNREKSVDEFNFQNKRLGLRQSHCRDCMSKAYRKHYENNKEAYYKKAKVWNDKNLEQNRHNLLEFFKTHPCVDCNEDHPACLQFDHVRGKKRNDVSNMIKGSPWDTIMTEIAKCEVRCANCHAKKTAKQFGYYTMI